MAEFKLKKIYGGSWYVPGPVNVGIVDTAEGCWLIDSGNDKDAGRKVNKTLRDTDRTLSGIVCTHSNADHIGGNQFLQQRTSCRILASRGEGPFINAPELEPAFLWGGRPFKQIKSKFFQAQESEVSGYLEPGSRHIFGKVIFLPGHFVDQIGVLTPDGVFYLGDSLFGEEVLAKYGIPFIYDIESFRESIALIRATGADWYLPSHGELTPDIDSVARANLAVADNLESSVLEHLAESIQLDDLLKGVCDRFGVVLNAGQYILIAATLRSLLSSLSDRGLAEYSFSQNRMHWKRCN